MQERLNDLKHHVREEDEEGEELDEIRAVQREIVKVYTKGTFNADNISLEI